MIAPPNPPSFYNDDIERYKAKFLSTIEKRKLYKRQVEKVFKSMEGSNPGDLLDQQAQWHAAHISNSHFKKTMKKTKKNRLPSRQSGTNFTNLDFDYRGNSSEILHLLRVRENSGSPNVGQLRFELGLRSYIDQNNNRR